ncbi:hypothetical protein DERF_010223 [Dermatophagoides farinae]|uniref:Uncharacterized protein n=1 Tax=Dermatophagoides farinae TaxID=6954 RepID=A0A922HY65_DERFA|nr:hypothetical protein DERF_010223 [Dermatophagoides farinae]
MILDHKCNILLSIKINENQQTNKQKNKPHGNQLHNQLICNFISKEKQKLPDSRKFILDDAGGDGGGGGSS